MKKLMSANWKMYKTRDEAVNTMKALSEALATLPDDREVALFAPYTALGSLADALGQTKNIQLGAENMYPAKEGAFTGEISPAMIRDCACRFVLIGHSERRSVLGETDEFIAKKVPFALENGLDVVLCIGETLEERESGRLEEVLERQLSSALAAVDSSVEAERLSIAYEPVWAIGTGKVAGLEDILATHLLVRNMLKKIFPEKADKMRILYGGSVKPDNAQAIVALDNVDGVLVGGASLEAGSFSKIVLA